MDAREAERALEDVEVVPVMEAAIPQAKEVLAACLSAEVPAVLGGGPGCATGGCSPKVRVFVREADVPQVRSLLEGRWKQLLENEGTLSAGGGPLAEGEEPPCPACGTAAPLVEGACSDCGLQLA